MADRQVGVALLAAGSSKRFGEADKLTAEFRGKRLGDHAAGNIPLSRFQRAWCVETDGSNWHPSGFELVVNPRAHEGMGASVALAARLAIETQLDALMIALADMPMVPSEHFEALLHTAQINSDIAVSAIGKVRTPPAVFGSDHFAQLAEANGDKGARELLSRGHIVPCPAQWLVDIDTPDDLQRYGQAG